MVVLISLCMVWGPPYKQIFEVWGLHSPIWHIGEQCWHTCQKPQYSSNRNQKQRSCSWYWCTEEGKWPWRVCHPVTEYKFGDPTYHWRRVYNSKGLASIAQRCQQGLQCDVDFCTVSLSSPFDVISHWAKRRDWCRQSMSELNAPLLYWSFHIWINYL